MELRHLALAVRDEAASCRFYQKYFGFDTAPPQRMDDGVLMLFGADDFHLALGPWEGEAMLPPFLHFGFRATSPAAVHSFAERIRRDGFEIVGQWHEPDYVSVKVRDPDGCVVEVACDSTAS